MPLKRITLEERRLEILLAPKVQRISIEEACEHYGVSSKWFYKWRKRYEDEGLLGLADRSRRPPPVSAKDSGLHGAHHLPDANRASGLGTKTDPHRDL